MTRDIDLDKLKRELPYKWRVQSFSRNKPVAACVAYIDSRDVQDLLDEVCGAENWQDEYYQVKNTMVCKIGIRINNGDWIWKSDGGTETDVEAEKGELSDSFKRAAVKWGIGRFLYAKKIVYVHSNTAKISKDTYCYVVDEHGKQVWDLTEYISNLPSNFRQGQTTSEPVQAPLDEEIRKCGICSGTMTYSTGVSKKSNKPYAMWKCNDNKEHFVFVKPTK